MRRLRTLVATRELQISRGERQMLKKFLRDETGLELSEYAVAAALIAIATVTAFQLLGGNITNKITDLANNVK
jgi:pilus assembly protein Flp/PilA